MFTPSILFHDMKRQPTKPTDAESETREIFDRER